MFLLIREQKITIRPHWQTTSAKIKLCPKNCLQGFHLNRHDSQLKLQFKKKVEEKLRTLTNVLGGRSR